MTTFREFGTALLDTEDLDPVYCMLTRANLPADMLKRWVVAYSMFYHAGVSSKLAASKDFWGETLENEAKFPRGTERRHFRGLKARQAITAISKYEPEELSDFWFALPTFKNVARRVQTLPMFGPWIAFKLADVGERVLQIPIDFSDCELAFYDEPRKAGALVELGDERAPVNLKAVTDRLIYEFSPRLAPPFYDREINIQEVETILCKYKSHVHGSYPVGKDSREVAHALKGYGWLADKLAHHVPKGT